MTKREFIEATKDMPDDARILVADTEENAIVYDAVVYLSTEADMPTYVPDQIILCPNAEQVLAR